MAVQPTVRIESLNGQTIRYENRGERAGWFSRPTQLADNWPAEVGKFWKIVPHAPTPDWPKPFYRFEATATAPAKIEAAG